MSIVDCMRRIMAGGAVWIATAGAWLLMALPSCEQRPIEPGLETTNIPWRIAYEFEQRPFLFAVWMESANNIIAGAPKQAYRIDYYMSNSQPVMLHYDGSLWSRMDFVYSPDSFGLSIWGAGPDNIFAAEGMLHHFDGNAWTETGLPAYVVGGNGEGDIFAASEDVIYRYDGQDWQPFYEKTGETKPPGALWAGSGPTVAVAWNREMVLWDGSRWRTQELAQINDVWGTSIDNLYAVGGKVNPFILEGGIWHFDGAGWAPVPMEDFILPLYGIWGTSHDNIYAAGEYGTMLHFDGIAWKEIEKTTVQNLYDIHGSGPDDICAVGENNTALRYDGSSWDAVSEVAPARALQVWAESPSRLIVWYSDGGFFRFEEGKWREEYAPFMSQMWIEDAFAGTAMDDLYASCDGSIYHFDGLRWTLSADSLQDIYSFYIAAPDDIIAVGDGTIYRFDGARWDVMMEGFLIRFYTVWGSSADNVFAGGDNGVILHFDGSSWKPMTSGAGGRIYGIWGAAADDVYAVGGAGILHYDGVKWSPQPGFENRSMRWIAGSSANNIVVVGYDELYHFDGLWWRRNETLNNRIFHVTSALDGSIVLATDDAIMYITE